MTGNLIIEKATPLLRITDSGAGNAELKIYDATDGGGTIFNVDGVLNIASTDAAGAWEGNLIRVATSALRFFGVGAATRATT